MTGRIKPLQVSRARDPAASTSSLMEPISVRVPQAIAMTGLSRSRLYELIKTGELQIAKDRKCTLILVSSLREVVQRRLR